MEARKRLSIIIAYLVKPIFWYVRIGPTSCVGIVNYDLYSKFLIIALECRKDLPIGMRFSYFKRDFVSIKINY